MPISFPKFGTCISVKACRISIFKKVHFQDDCVPQQKKLLKNMFRIPVKNEI
jgi:hypothetical protein